MHHKDANQTHREKATWELHKNATSYLEQFLKATHHETTAVRPHTSHLKNHPNTTNKTCRTLLEKQGRTHKCRSPMDLFKRTCQCLPTGKNLPTTDLQGHRILFGKPARSDGWYGQMMWEKELGKYALIAWPDDDDDNDDEYLVTNPLH